ncbi:MAG: WYL domain-containing protein [Treponemataceae bacterium]|nr:WYL domain-containing protein [Treponemataceae bacterium]
MPVFAERGRGGGISVVDGYAFDKAVLSEEEWLSVLSSVKAVRELSGGGSPCEAGAISAKLAHLARGNSDWIAVDFAPWSPSAAAVRGLFALLKEAVVGGRQIAFDYFSGRGEMSRRTVQPWKVVFRGQGWYVYGYCNQKAARRYFKLSRMRNVSLLEDAVSVSEESVPAECVEPSAAQNADNGAAEFPIVPLVLSVSARSIFRLLDEFDCTRVERAADGGAVVETSAPDAPWLTGWLLSFGTDVRVLSPVRIREDVRREILLLAARESAEADI